MNYIDTTFYNAYGTLCYLKRKDIECEICPIIDGVPGWPDNPLPYELKKYSWRLSYDSDAKGAEHSIEKMLEMFGRGLKYCPFCAGIAEVVHEHPFSGKESYETARVRCTECGCATPSVIIDGYYGAETTEQDVIDKWNKRA